MDDLIRTGLAIIIALCAAAALLIYGVACLVFLEIHALAAGDTGLTVASIVGVLLISAGYIGTGLWLRRTGRI